MMLCALPAEHRGRKKTRMSLFAAYTQQTDQSDWFFALHRPHFISCLPCRERENSLSENVCVLMHAAVLYSCMTGVRKMHSPSANECLQTVKLPLSYELPGTFLFSRPQGTPCMTQTRAPLLQDCNIHNVVICAHKCSGAVQLYLLLHCADFLIFHPLLIKLYLIVAKCVLTVYNEFYSHW